MLKLDTYFLKHVINCINGKVSKTRELLLIRQINKIIESEENKIKMAHRNGSINSPIVTDAQHTTINTWSESELEKI